MECGEHQVAGLGGLQACRHRLDAAKFADEENVGIGAQGAANAFGKRRDIAPDLILRDDALEPQVRVLYGIDGMFDISMLDLRSDVSCGDACDLSNAVASAMNVVAPAAMARGTNVTFLASTRQDVSIGSDRLLQILINVIENAIKHGRERGRIFISIHALDARYVEVRVDDDGPGVAPEERDLIFSLARRGTNARARGSGLGLAVARLMIERIGGEVDVAPSLMGGAMFRIRLPVAVERDDGPVQSAGSA